MVKQMYDNKTAEQADWLIGENCLYPGVDGFSLRDMKNPGQAYKNLWVSQTMFLALWSPSFIYTVVRACFRAHKLPI